MPADLEVITRPDGRQYRPRKIVAHPITDADDILCGVLVTGTHDPDRAIELARRGVTAELGRGYEPVDPIAVWWRNSFAGGRRCWVTDEKRGQAGVFFGEIVEVPDAR